MNILYMIFLLIFIVAAALMLNSYLSSLSDMEEADSASGGVLEEMTELLKTVNASAETEEERKIRYRELKCKYNDTFIALGHRFPEYSSIAE